MGKLRSTDWTAIKWYMKEFNYKIKDMMVWPTITFRNSQNEKVEANIGHIKSKYANRPKGKKIKVAS